MSILPSVVWKPIEKFSTACIKEESVVDWMSLDLEIVDIMIGSRGGSQKYLCGYEL